MLIAVDARPWKCPYNTNDHHYKRTSVKFVGGWGFVVGGGGYWSRAVDRGADGHAGLDQPLDDQHHLAKSGTQWLKRIGIPE